MTRCRSLIILSVLTGIIILAAGCMGQSLVGNAPAGPGSGGGTVSPGDTMAISATPSQTPDTAVAESTKVPQTRNGANPTAPVTGPVKNQTSWIAIAPIGKHTAGEIFTISGTTNLPAGTTLWYPQFGVVTPKPYETPPLYVTGVWYGPLETVVESGSGGINTWSVNGATRSLPPGSYVFTIKKPAAYPDDEVVEASASFELVADNSKE